MPIRALVVDDESSIHELVAEYLRGRGMDVDVARGGREAMALLSATRFDVLLTDFRLPDIDGLDLVRHATAAVPPVPAVVMTGSATVESAVLALRLGAMDFVLKPFRLRELHAMLLAAMERSRTVHLQAGTVNALRFLERAELAEERAEALALLPALGEVLASLPGAHFAEITLGQNVVGSHGTSLGDAESWSLPGGYRVRSGPASEAAIPYVRAMERALRRAGV
ncbi:MAG: response regulator [Deltaproteobacteria bacterium]|nr:response regulator [Deltaproteobacteria bacterium]